MKTESQVRTLDQRRAAHAWDVVEKAGGLDEKDKETFAAEAKKLPTRILASGLGQALAFLEAKGAAPLLREGLSDWLAQRRPPAAGEEVRLVVRVIRGDVDFLRFATAESLAYLTWLVRWCEARKLG
jgi:CRISPR-associated protein Cmr5